MRDESGTRGKVYTNISAVAHGTSSYLVQALNSGVVTAPGTHSPPFVLAQ